MKVDVAKYDALIDLLVAALVREISAESTNEKPAAPWQASPRVEDQRVEIIPHESAARE
jgi:hypothetical protein